MNAPQLRCVPFKQVDVFTKIPFRGNPVAVILDGDGLSSAQMQAIAGWTNLSETTFVCAPTQTGADYKLRIFTPKEEIPFAGHPTLGSAWALLQFGLKPKKEGRLVQECAKGLIVVRQTGDLLSFSLPQPTFAEPGKTNLTKVARALGIDAEDILLESVIDVGPVWLTLQLPSAESVVNLKPDMVAIAALSQGGYTGITVFGLHDSRDHGLVEVRSFAPAFGVPEDPVCGSGNGCVAALIRCGHALDGASYVARQGQTLGRDGYVHIEFDAEDTIWVGGNAVTCIDGLLAV